MARRGKNVRLVKLSSGNDFNGVAVKPNLPANETFEAFYLRDAGTGTARAAHSHGSFYKYRNPALVEAKNAAAYGYRFDGKRRFNYD
ncbi:hypothetical protein WA026_016306 [Henosepilachna vigintioctopunctata]|uniref:Uncharacterized protein n=1 Tax=Henosepilachna vigintioctopunctata TaxID=420089 RepID=A0AAW1UNL9_9CUCU